ncbi:hypothetical protein [Deefgea rivuli]|uniref:hypothetical protein n=1 Tax=Deefgea rivuli TaxID=400948 RepID=UPI0012EBEFC3|nr:hypothetical protein [Deefgea rivuli]
MNARIKRISILSTSLVSFLCGLFIFVPLLAVMAILNSFNSGYEMEHPFFFVFMLFICSLTFALCCTLGVVAYNLISRLGIRFNLMIEVDEIEET